MKQLIISNYDSECDFTWVVIDNGNEIKKSHNARDLTKYHLYDETYCWFDESMIKFNENELIQDFDMIIYCDNGSIHIYKKDKENIKMSKVELMKKLLDKVNMDKSSSLRFLMDRGLVDCREYTVYSYYNKYGEYIGNAEKDSYSYLLDKIIEDQVFDVFMEKFIDNYQRYLPKHLVENKEGLSKKAIAEKILEEE